MEREEYRKHYELEESHWWFAGRRKIILSTLEFWLNLPQDAYLLDAGCGTGFNLKLLQRYPNSFGFDSSEEAIRFCQKRGLKNIIRADAQIMPFKSQIFDVVFLLDVLYHKKIKSDLSVLQDVHRVLKKGGYLFISDSAFNFLSSRHDEAVHARERYTGKTLSQRLKKADFAVLKISYFHFFLFLPVLFFRLWEKIRGRGKKAPESHLKKVDRRTNSWLFKIFSAEAFFLKHISFPFGSSLLCVTRKNS